MIATNTYGRHVSTGRAIVIIGWVLLGVVYVTAREIAGLVFGRLIERLRGGRPTHRVRGAPLRQA